MTLNRAQRRDIAARAPQPPPANPACKCGSTDTRQWVADTDPLGMQGSVWMCDQCALGHTE